MIDKAPPLKRDYNRDPNIKALKWRGFMTHGLERFWMQMLEDLRDRSPKRIPQFNTYRGIVLGGPSLVESRSVAASFGQERTKSHYQLSQGSWLDAGTQPTSATLQ